MNGCCSRMFSSYPVIVEGCFVPCLSQEYFRVPPFVSQGSRSPDDDEYVFDAQMWFRDDSKSQRPNIACIARNVARRTISVTITHSNTGCFVTICNLQFLHGSYVWPSKKDMSCRLAVIELSPPSGRERKLPSQIEKICCSFLVHYCHFYASPSGFMMLIAASANYRLLYYGNQPSRLSIEIHNNLHWEVIFIANGYLCFSFYV